MAATPTLNDTPGFAVPLEGRKLTGGSAGVISSDFLPIVPRGPVLTGSAIPLDRPGYPWVPFPVATSWT